MKVITNLVEWYDKTFGKDSPEARLRRAELELAKTILELVRIKALEEDQTDDR